MTVYTLETTNGLQETYFSEKALINDVLVNNYIIGKVTVKYSPPHAGVSAPTFDVTKETKKQLRKRLTFFYHHLRDKSNCNEK